MLPDQPGDVPRTAADVSKAQRLLGYEPKVSFEEGIRRTAEWYRESYMLMDADGGGETGDRTKTPHEGGDDAKAGSMKRSNSLLSFVLGSHGETGGF